MNSFAVRMPGMANLLWSLGKGCQMIICFECPSATRDEMDRLVAKGSYRDYGEVIVAAVRNQALMEQAVAETGPIVMNRSSLQQNLTSPDAAASFRPVMAEPGPTAPAAGQATRATKPKSRKTR